MQMLDHFDLWFDHVFTGRPKVGFHSATDSVALFLIPSPNPIIALWGVGIRQLEAVGCPISASGGPCVTGYRKLATPAPADLVTQFGPSAGSTYFSQDAYLQSLHNPASHPAAPPGRHQGHN